VQRNAARMKRLCTKPYLLRRPYVYGLMPLHALISFHISPWQLPLLGWAIILANGFLARLHRQENFVI
jgi:hypothetical protein